MSNVVDAKHDSFDADLVALLRANVEPAPTIIKERVSKRLAASTGALLRGSPSGQVAGKAPSPIAALHAHPLLFASVFAFGGVAGVATVMVLRPPQTEVRYVERPTAPAISAAPNTAGAPSISDNSASASPKAATGASPSAAIAGERRGSAPLAEQQALLDEARRAFAREDYGTTMKTLDTHSKRYPMSVLGEEREALEIKTLAAVGRTAEAKLRLARFEARFPQSLLFPSLVDSVKPNP